MHALQILFNVLGGVLTVIVVGGARWGWAVWNRRRFRQFFGEDIFSGTESRCRLVYGSFLLDESILDQSKLRRDKNGHVTKMFYLKEGKPSVRISIDKPISSCEIRAIKYLAEVMGGESQKTPSLSTDDDLKAVLNLSFVALGGPNSNFKTEDAIEDDGNQFVRFCGNWFVDKEGKPVPGYREKGFDYGLIMKIHPSQFPERTWFACAGFAEWGTSGAAWYLAHRWKKIHRNAKAKAFAIIVNVRPHRDQSAQPVVERYGCGPWSLPSA